MPLQWFYYLFFNYTKAVRYAEVLTQLEAMLVWSALIFTVGSFT